MNQCHRQRPRNFFTWAQTDLAKAKASLHRKNGALSEAVMYLSIGVTDRAKEVLNRALIDL